MPTLSAVFGQPATSKPGPTRNDRLATVAERVRARVESVRLAIHENSPKGFQQRLSEVMGWRKERPSREQTGVEKLSVDLVLAEVVRSQRRSAREWLRGPVGSPEGSGVAAPVRFGRRADSPSEPFAEGGQSVNIKRIGDREFVASYDSPAERDAAIAAFALACSSRRICDRCVKPLEAGEWGALCLRCSDFEISERELAERMHVR